jgi:phage baseplate assembly protein W
LSVFDLSHQWASDLSIGPTGDLALVSGSILGQQRVLRRLMTNPGDYIWQLGYGAGLGQFIGQPTNASQIQAVIRSQIFKEAAVARTPEPVISVQADPTSGAGTVYVQIRYVDAATGQTQVLSFSVNG